MEEKIYITRLFDYYGELLTDKQKEYFIDYYIENLTLAEIAENNDISRNAIHKQLKEVEAKLNFYEAKLQLIKKSDKINDILNKITDDKVKEEIKELI